VVQKKESSVVQKKINDRLMPHYMEINVGKIKHAARIRDNSWLKNASSVVLERGLMTD
jgi:hypothetical protein